MTETSCRAPYDALIGIGTNLGDKIANIDTALRLLSNDGAVRVEARSKLYQSPPWGVLDQDWFVNIAAAVTTDLEPHALLARCLAVEDAMGRVRRQKWGPRLVDVDVLTYRGQTIDTPDLEGAASLHRNAQFRGFAVVGYRARRTRARKVHRGDRGGDRSGRDDCS